jgi:hypothetical protein
MTINEMIELRKAATDGPWKAELYAVVGQVPKGRPGGEVIVQCRPTYSGLVTPQNENAAYIAACGNFDWEAVRDVVAAASNDILMELDLLISRYKQIAQHHSSNEDDRQGALSAIKEVQNKLDRLSSALARLEG